MFLNFDKPIIITKIIKSLQIKKDFIRSHKKFTIYVYLILLIS